MNKLKIEYYWKLRLNREIKLERTCYLFGFSFQNKNKLDKFLSTSLVQIEPSTKKCIGVSTQFKVFVKL